MTPTKFIFALGISLFTCGLYAAETSDFETAFKSGVAKYQEKKFDEARLSLEEALKINPESVQTLVNLALAQYQLGKKGPAIALLRKARTLDPNFSTPQAALQFIEPQLEVKEVPHEIQLWESIRSHFIVPFSMSAFLALNALGLFATGWLFIGYFSKRRRSLKEGLALPAFPLIPSIIAVFFVLFMTLTVLKSWDYSLPRGTILSDKIAVSSAPAEKSPALFDLYTGLEVLLGMTEGDWVQVTYPGAQTGWIPKSSVLQTSGRTLW